MSTDTCPDASALPGLPGDGNEPVFANPWQAKIFALVVGLHQRGCFSWGEWNETLSTEIIAERDKELTHRDDKSQKKADPGDSYYRLWVTALERVLSSKTMVRSDEIERRVVEWRSAYRNTPHHKAVTLSKVED